jgi:hypothetical protein
MNAAMFAARRNRLRTTSRWLVCAALLTVAGNCGSNQTTEASTVSFDNANQSFIVFVGNQLDVTLLNIGPTEVTDPPTVSTSAIAYLGWEVSPLTVPAGLTQRFKFLAQRRGDAIVRFLRRDGTRVIATVEDTIRVQ